VKFTSSHLKISKTVKTVLESGFQAVDFGFHVSGTWVPKSSIYQNSSVARLESQAPKPRAVRGVRGLAPPEDFEQ